MLLALGLDELKTYVPPKTTKKDTVPAKSRKRKSPPPLDPKNEDESDTKVLKTRATQDITNTGIRRSARNAGKVVDYKKEVVKAAPEVISPAARNAKNSEGKSTLERRHSPYVNLRARCHITVNDVIPAGSSMAIFPMLRLASGGRPGALSSNPYRSRIKRIRYREACSADSIHA